MHKGAITTTAGSDYYWAEQIQNIQPACFATPNTSEEVACVVKAAQKRECLFAIRGSGHSDVPGASNLAGGLVLNLGNLQQIKVAPGNAFTSIGPGNDWGDVYSFLDPFNLTVVGGRETTVGVSGLTLGGGISYFSGQYGFACDNVLNYEVVLADGSIVNVNSSSNSDLYRALRGGGNNFGVVTRFDLETYEYNLMHGGLIAWADTPETSTNEINAFVNFAKNAPKNQLADIFLALVSEESTNTFLWTGGLYYDKPYQAHPAVFDPFYTAELNRTRLDSTERTTTHGNLATELGLTQPSGMRQQFHTGTFVANETLLTEMVQIFREEVKRASLAGSTNGSLINANFALQPITRNLLKHQSKRGGNVLGLGVDEAPLALLSMSWPWTLPGSDDLIIGAMNRIVSRSKAAAQKLGLFNEFIYMNYARPSEPVIQGYGAENQAFLQKVSKKYDPDGVFQKLVPGGFKL